ncbi:hypothetical protein PTW37_10700 [Arthrobacter agilis]|uniref:hypothetical protein n=1 Tax=Arthrobacter agilis TaxID=37921 RepID=UPI002365A6B4|nr:hypothetical protein [Arthrobacter agilis]WDF32338.1 hypothetical protein PTW37_10700 [Arthrobacter agilis]
MKRSAWIITAVLVVVAVVASWFFGLDNRHGAALVGAAVAAGVANGLLESVEVPRATLAPLPEHPRGLADIQSLEFSFSSAEPGTRAVLEVHALAAALLAAHPGAPAGPALRAFAGRPPPASPDHRTLQAFVHELDHMMQALQEEIQ